MLENNRATEIKKITGLNSGHFADLVRLAQLIFDPTGGLPRRKVEVNWQSLGIPIGVVNNLKAIGKKYQYASPYTPIDIIWGQLNPESRNWTIENKSDLWKFEECFPARDED